MEIKLRPYQIGDVSELTKLGDVSVQAEGWKPYFPNGWKREDTIREFLLNSKTLELLQSPDTYNFLQVGHDKRLQGAVIGQSLQSLVPQLPDSTEEKFSELGWLDGNTTYYQRHIAVFPDCPDKHLVKRLFTSLKQHAAENGFERIVVGVPPINQRGINLMKFLRYRGEVHREAPGTEKPEFYPLVYFSQKIR